MQQKPPTILDTVFPRDNDPNTRKGLKTWAKIAPFVAIAVLFLFTLLGPVGVFLAIICSIPIIGLILTALSMKKAGRDPSAILAIIPLTPLKILTVLIIVGGTFAYFAQPEYVTLQKEYRKSNPGKPIPKERHFGFTVGETTFGEAIEIFNQANASYTIEYVKDTYIRSLKSEDYPGEKIPLEKIELDFDQENKIYNIKAHIDAEKLTEEDIYSIHKAFNYKYTLISRDPFDAKESQLYLAISGAHIYFDPDSRFFFGKRNPYVSITNSPKKESVEMFRENTKRRLGKEFSEKFL